MVQSRFLKKGGSVFWPPKFPDFKAEPQVLLAKDDWKILWHRDNDIGVWEVRTPGWHVQTANLVAFLQHHRTEEEFQSLVYQNRHFEVWEVGQPNPNLSVILY